MQDLAKKDEMVILAAAFAGPVPEYELRRRLADRGDKYAMFRLGEMYRDGEGVPRDYALSHYRICGSTWRQSPDTFVPRWLATS
jgi:hypothetical protein